MARSVCSLSLDLDNQWSYMKTHGDPGWEALPSYLDVVVPRVLDTFQRLGWKITFFIVGQDAALEKNHAPLAAIAAAGHEVANHSFHHEPWIHLYSRERIDAEISRAEEAIERATGRRPAGFRGPGYSLSKATLEILLQRGYRYDASTLPTYLGPLARAYYFLASDLSPAEKQQRRDLFGGIGNGLRPLRPYLWRLDQGELLEVPVTTVPIFKVPFHFSYLLYISSFSRTLSFLYFAAALNLCKLTGTQPSLLLHPLDFLGSDDVSELDFFPGMTLTSAHKAECLMRYLRHLGSGHRVLPITEHSTRLLGSRRLRSRSAIGLDGRKGA